MRHLRPRAVSVSSTYVNRPKIYSFHIDFVQWTSLNRPVLLLDVLALAQQTRVAQRYYLPHLHTLLPSPL